MAVFWCYTYNPLDIEMKKAVNSSETSGNIYQTIWLIIPEDRHLEVSKS